MAASQRILRAVLAPILIILFYGAWAISPMGMALEERFGLEALFKLRGPVKVPKNVVVVAITKRSAKDLGYSNKLYEWSRFVHADVVNQLTALGARYDNRISFLTTGIGSLAHLTALFLFDNDLYELPAEIGDLVALEELDVSRERVRQLEARIVKNLRAYMKDNLVDFEFYAAPDGD